jgi:hypothetical protein|tara:strand:+ start:1878 stop:2669 length:792 start_codon:yes stop_codon:yes gene_type:complete
MAINVDTVYKTVLLILNKEQRGYMTPPEFNRIGTQVQLDIFEQYFEDLNQQLRVPQPDVDYADRQMALDEKISPFKTTGTASLNNLPTYWDLPTIDFYGRSVVYNQLVPLTGNQIAFYKLGTVTYKPTVQTPVVLPTELQRLGRAEFYNLQKSDLTAASVYSPVYLYENNKLFVSPALAANTVTVDFLRKPLDIQWAFAAGPGGSYAFNSIAGGGSVNFELSSTEQTNVILKILLYAGIVIRDPQIVQAASQQIQQEEINKKS